MGWLKDDIILSFSLYEMIYYFIIYSILGWCMEVIYATFKTKSFINRGFLNGCWCPLYGAGATLIIVILNPIGEYPFLIFISSILITSTIEFFTGFVLELLYHKKWWDYSQRKFNIKGYICLEFSLIWGILCLLAYLCIHPGIRFIVNKIPFKFGAIALLIFVLAFIFDIIISTIQATRFARYVRRIRNTYRKTSDVIGEKISETTIVVMDKLSSAKLKASQIRILKAFPTMKDKKDKNIISAIREKIENRKNKPAK